MHNINVNAILELPKGGGLMLTSYTVKGFKSFKEETTVDLTPTNYKTLAEQNIYDGVLKGVLFVGANASGKSNIIMAIKVLAELLFAKYEINIFKDICLFADNDEMEFTFNFKINGSNIKYYIEFKLFEGFSAEKLYIDNNIMLERIGDSARSYIAKDALSYSNISHNVLVLREIYFNTKFRNNDTLIKWFDFLNSFIYYDLCKQKQVSFKEDIFNLYEYLDKFGVKKVNEFFEEYEFRQQIDYESAAINNVSKNKQIWFLKNDINVHLPFEWESLGNQTLLTLLNKFFYIVENGGILILDEFSSGFHNDLEELLIKYFMKNAKNAQLFFVSHSTNLLSNRLLRPDQIYTVAFEGKHGSVLNRISNEQPREAQNLEKMYLGGVFGGLPNYETNDK